MSSLSQEVPLNLSPPPQELQLRCTEGQALLNSLLLSRELVVPSGAPQTDDRALESLQQDWRLYQARLADTRALLNGTLARLRQMEQKFQRLDSWLKAMEAKADLRSHRRSERATKEAQLQMTQVRAQTAVRSLPAALGSQDVCARLLRAGRRRCWFIRRRWRASLCWPSRFWTRRTSAAGSAPEPPRSPRATMLWSCIYW